MKVPDFVAQLVEVGARRLLAKTSMQEAAARVLMFEVAEELCFRNARSTLYVPEFPQLANVERNQQCWELYSTVNDQFPHSRPFTSDRVDELACHFGYSRQWVYRVIKTFREAQATQCGLPKPEGGQ